MGWTKLIASITSGADVSGTLEELANKFDLLSEGITGFSKAANDANDNYTKLLDGMADIGKSIGELDAISKTLFGTSSKLGKSFGAVLKPLRLISQSVGSFAQVQRIFAEAAGAVDALSAGVRQTHSEFHVLSNTFGGTYAEAKKLSEVFVDLQRKSGSEAFGNVSRKELMDTADAMASANIEISRMSEVIPSAGANMDFLTASVLQADAMSISTAEHMSLMSDAIMKTGLSSDEAFKQLAGFKVISDKTGLSTSKIASSLNTAVGNFQMLGLSADFAKPLMLGFAESLSSVGVGMEHALGLSQTLTKSLAGLGDDYGMAHLVSSLGGLEFGQDGSAISAGIEIEKAMLDAETTGDFEELGATLAGGMRRTLEHFGGGEIVTLNDAAADPSKRSQYYMQKEFLSGQFQMSGQEASRTLEMLEQLDAAEAAGDSDTSKALKEQLADQVSGRNDTMALMEKQNVHTAGIFAHAQMQTQMQSMMLRKEAGGEMLDQMKAEAEELGKAYTDATQSALKPEYIKNAAANLHTALQGTDLKGKGEGASGKATFTETFRGMAVDAPGQVEKVSASDIGKEMNNAIDKLINYLASGGQLTGPAGNPKSNPPPVKAPSSDIRLKEDITHIGVSESGLNIYTFRYIGDSILYQGVMAQELLVSNPEAVLIGDNGYYRVDYSLIDVDFIPFKESSILLNDSTLGHINARI